MLTSILMIVVVIVGGVAALVFNSYYKLWKRRKNAKGKMFCIFRKPSGEYDFEFCLVKGRAIFRGVQNYSDIKDISGVNDARLGREVYFLKERDPSYYLVTPSGKNGHNEDAKEAVGASVVASKRSMKAESVYMGPRGKIMSRKEFEEAKRLDPTLEGQMAASGRGHALFPILSTSFWDQPVSVSVGYFVEGFSIEVDPLDVALQEFGVDPQYNAAMIGHIVDEKLTKLWAWWSNRFEDLLQKMAKQVNPTVMYIVLGVLVVGLLVCIGLIYSMRGDISALKDAIPNIGTP